MEMENTYFILCQTKLSICLIFLIISSSFGAFADSGIIIYSDIIPASTAPFKVYHNTGTHDFAVSYPSDWTITTNQNGPALTVSFDYQVYVGPDDYPLEIDCDANPGGLTAQQWSEAQSQLTPQASQKLASGIEAFVATGQGEGAYTAYTVVKGRQACTLVAFNTSIENAKLIDRVVNSFNWK